MTDLTMKNRHTQDRPSQPLPENNPNIESTSITAFTGFPGKPEPFVASVRMSKLPFNIDAYTEASKLDKNNSLARDFSPRNDSSTRDHAYFKMSRNDKTKNIFSTNASSKVSDARPEQATQKTQPMI